MHSILWGNLVRDDFVIIDSQFPQPIPLGFRNTEINGYLKTIINATAYSMYPMLPGPEAWFEHGYGVDGATFQANKKSYLKQYPQNKRRIKYLESNKSYRFNLAYSFFLAETYVLLPFYEKNKVPFVFVLYPGGGFGINNPKSDEMLNKIFNSPYFRGVIVTQKITESYLLNNKMCPSKKIHYIYGGFVQFNKTKVLPKKHYNKDKKTFDICFVAAKYSDNGKDKGYDLFIETAKKIAPNANDINFHVIGGFDENDIDVHQLGNRINFYGYKTPDFLLDFYSNMDIFIGPSRPGELYPGNFDGFPLGIDAGYCGVALFVSDELKMNNMYNENEEIVIVPLDSNTMADKIMQYYTNIDALYDLSKRGMLKTQKLFDSTHQLNERIKVFEAYTELEHFDARISGEI